MSPLDSCRGTSDNNGPIPTESEKMNCRKLCTAVLASFACCAGLADDPDLIPLKHNNPELVVDLGVGLWAHPLPMDFDGDGDNDLVVSCPDKPFNGTWFFENPDGNVALPTFRPPVKIGRGAHSMRVSYDGDRVDVTVPGTVWEDFPNTHFSQPRELTLPSPLQTVRKMRANQWHLIDWDRDGRRDLIVGQGTWDDYGWDDAWDQNGNWTNGPLHGHVFLVRNQGSNEVPKWTTGERLMAGDEPVDVYGWPSPCVADFDGDGDRDLICGEFLNQFTWFENTGSDSAIQLSSGTRVRTPDGSELGMELQMIVPTPIDWDKDGDADLIVGDEDGRVAFVENVTGESGSDHAAGPVFCQPVYFQQQADWLKFGALATPCCTDWDGDGDTDILCGNTAGQIGWFENQGGQPTRWGAPTLLKADGETIRIMAGPNGSIQGPCEARWGYTTLCAADWDLDGRTDLVVNSIWGKVVWYRNTGTAADGLPELAAAQPVRVEWSGPTPKPAWTWWDPVGQELVTQWRTTPECVDFNGDGLTDLVMLDQEGYMTLFERTREDGSLRLQPPQRIFVDENGEPLRLNERTAGGSGRRKIHIVDWDGDNDPDLLTNSMNADLYENKGSDPNGNTVLRHVGPVGTRKLAGHTSSPASIDLNGNGVADLLVGAEDGHLYLLSR